MQRTVRVCVYVCDRESEYKHLTSAAYIRPCCTLVRMFTHLTLQLTSLNIIESLSFQCRAQIDTLFYSILFWFSLSLCPLVAAFGL